jgi:hypothetical protein
LALGKEFLRRVTRSQQRALGKEPLCREPGLWLSAKPQAHGKGSVFGSDYIERFLAGEKTRTAAKNSFYTGRCPKGEKGEQRDDPNRSISRRFAISNSGSLLRAFKSYSSCSNTSNWQIILYVQMRYICRKFLVRVSRYKNRACSLGIPRESKGKTARTELAVWAFLGSLKVKLPYLNCES